MQKRQTLHRINTQRLAVDDGLVQDDASYEPNNSKYAAYPIISGAEYSSTLDKSDDFDWYALELEVASGDEISR